MLIKPKEKLKNDENNEIKIDGQEFRVVSTLNDEATGAQAMAVAPIVNGEPDYNSVAVVAAGTTPTDPKDLAGAVVSWQSKTNPSPQLYSVGIWLHELRKKYTITQLTGYSQGSFVIQLGAKYHIPTTVFNGWFSYATLTKEEANYIKKNTHLFKNYRRTDDNTVLLFDGNLKKENGGSGFGTIYWVSGSSHKIFDWEFNDKGELVDENGKVVAPSTQASYLMVSATIHAMLEHDLASLQILRNQLKADGSIHR